MKLNITLDVLNKVDIRVGTIKLKLTVDFGDFTRTILVGMKGEKENPKEIEEKQTLFVVNLEPRKMAGEISE